LRGAEKVIGIEPLPRNYQIAQKNIELNKLSNTITLHLAGCTARPSKIIVDDNYDDDFLQYEKLGNYFLRGF
jgi:FkbM family methyltransferase